MMQQLYIDRRVDICEKWVQSYTNTQGQSLNVHFVAKAFT